MQQAEDFRAEAQVLAAATQDLTDADFDRATLFKSWTIGDVIGHLHMFDIAAELSLRDEAEFSAFLAPVYKAMGEGRSMIEAQNVWLAEIGLSGRALRDAWAAQSGKTANAYADVDPKKRLKWAGPDMSARSMITARQMETWAHGQEVFDVLGKDRVEADRIKNICHLGVTTYGWTFAVRREKAPEPAPYVRLTAPSGAIWEWNDVDEANMVSGSAVGFAQTVAQTRNVADTDIQTTGEAAAQWMTKAQCFAGAPNDPPAPGARHKAKEA